MIEKNIDNLYMTLVNKDNSHIGGILSSNQGGVRGTGGKIVSGGKCVGIKHYGGKKKPVIAEKKDVFQES